MSVSVNVYSNASCISEAAFGWARVGRRVSVGGEIGRPTLERRGLPGLASAFDTNMMTIAPCFSTCAAGNLAFNVDNKVTLLRALVVHT